MSWCFPVFFSIHVLLDFFRVSSLALKYLLYPFARPSFAHSRSLGEFQALDWLWHPLTWGPRDGLGVSVEQKSRPKFLPLPGFNKKCNIYRAYKYMRAYIHNYIYRAVNAYIHIVTHISTTNFQQLLY